MTSYIFYVISRNIDWIDFLFFSDSGQLLLLKTASPSSLYNPCKETTDWRFYRDKLYRDDGLYSQSIFRENELKITIQYNLKIVDYLDVTFNHTDSYRPFNKTNNEINSIHKQSNHLLPSLSKYLYLSKDV